MTKRLKFFRTRRKRHDRSDAKRNIVSDHAVVQYLRHRDCFDIDLLREEIIGTNSKAVKSMEHGKIEDADKNLTLVVRDGCVVTVLPVDG